MRSVELIVCWDDRTWDMVLVSVPSGTPEERLESAARDAFLSGTARCGDEYPVYVGLYSYSDDEPAADDEEVQDA